MKKSYSRIRHTQETNMLLENRFLSERKNRMFEQVQTGGVQTNTQQQTGEKQISGPYGLPPRQYYVFEKGGKFYIYITNASQKKPVLMDGTLWSNDGKGYNTQDEATNIINQQINPEKNSQVEVSPREKDDEVY